MTEVLPDVLKRGLKVVIVGTAAGRTSAAAGQYYARSGNRFWTALFDVGLTPRLLHPSEFRTLPEFGIGLTDIAKQASGMDSELSASDFDVAGFRKKMIEWRPSLIAFNGLRAASEYSGRKLKSDSMGIVLPGWDGFSTFIVAQTSGGNGHWGRTKDSWKSLSEQVQSHSQES